MRFSSLELMSGCGFLRGSSCSMLCGCSFGAAFSSGLNPLTTRFCYRSRRRSKNASFLLFFAKMFMSLSWLILRWVRFSVLAIYGRLVRSCLARGSSLLLGPKRMLYARDFTRTDF